MTKLTKNLSLVAAVGALVTVSSVVAVSGTSAPPAAAPVVEQAAVQLSAQQVQMQRTAIFAAAGRSAIQHVVAARQALGGGVTEEAKQYLGAADETLAAINKALKSDGADLSRVVIGLYAQVGVMEETEFTDQQTRQLNELGPLVAAGEHDKVAESLGRLGVAMAYSYVEMPLAAATAGVDAAVAALDAGDVAGAAASLKLVEDGLVTETVTVGVAAQTAPEPGAAEAAGSEPS